VRCSSARRPAALTAPVQCDFHCDSSVSVSLWLWFSLFAILHFVLILIFFCSSDCMQSSVLCLSS